MPFPCHRLSLALLTGLAVAACGEPDQHYQQQLLTSVGQVVCSQDRREREAGVVALAEAIDEFRPTSPYENRRMAIKAAVEDVRAGRCDTA